jgi:hypothetical protein
VEYGLEALEVLRSLEVVRQIAEGPGCLTGREVRLLRQHMQWTARKLAERIGCDFDDVVGCEWNYIPLPPDAERSLRWLFLPVSRRWKTIVGPRSDQLLPVSPVSSTARQALKLIRRREFS